MKEAFWGVLIVMLGLLGIVILQLFQNITVTNDQTYYLLKETTEAAMYDAIDLSYYRTKGKVRIVEDKFVENLTRRFAESATLNRTYNIVVHEINEEPPRVSLSIGTYVFSLRGSTFNIGQSIDAIIESKFDKEDEGQEVEVVEPTPVKGECPVCVPGEDPNCNAVKECIVGDLRFVGWGKVNVPEKICQGDSTSPKTIEAIYQSCDCGKWVEKKEQITANPVTKTDRVEYTWRFQKSSSIRDIDESTTKKTYYDVCTTGLDLECPNGKITLVKGQTHRIVPKYIPENAVNRDLTWTSSDTSIVTVIDAVKAPEYPGTDDATITASSTKTGTAIITARTTNGKSDTCTVEVVDNDWICPTEPLEIKINSTGQAVLRNNFTVPGMKWSIENTSIATIDQNTGLITTKGNSANISYSVEAPGYSKLTCPLKVVSTGCKVGTISASWSKSSLPALCAEDISNTSSAYYDAIKIIAYPKFCGKDGNFNSCDNGRWTTGTQVGFYNPTSREAMDNTPGQVVNVEKTDKIYTITWSLTYRYGGWASNSFNCQYMKERNQVTTTYKLTGKILQPSDGAAYERCKSVERSEATPDAFVANCPNSDVVAGTTGGVNLYAEYTPPGKFSGTVKWILNGPGSLSTTTGNKTVYTPPSKNKLPAGSPAQPVTIYYEINDDRGRPFKDVRKCKFDVVPFYDCSEFVVHQESSRLCYKTTSQYYLRYKNGNAFTSNAFWYVTNGTGVLTPTYNGAASVSVNLTGSQVGTATVYAERQVGQCTKEQNKSEAKKVTIYPSEAYCSSSLYVGPYGEKCIRESIKTTATCDDPKYNYLYKGKCYVLKSQTASTKYSCVSGTLFTTENGERRCGIKLPYDEINGGVCTGVMSINGQCYTIGKPATKTTEYSCSSGYTTVTTSGGKKCINNNDYLEATCPDHYTLVSGTCYYSIDAEFRCQN